MKKKLYISPLCDQWCFPDIMVGEGTPMVDPVSGGNNEGLNFNHDAPARRLYV